MKFTFYKQDTNILDDLTVKPCCISKLEEAKCMMIGQYVFAKQYNDMDLTLEHLSNLYVYKTFTL